VAKGEDGNIHITRIVRAECTCIAKNSGKCWHVGGLCYLIQCFPRPPVVPTDDFKAWDQGKVQVVADINKPVCRLQVANNMRRVEDAKEKVRKPDMRDGTGDNPNNPNNPNNPTNSINPNNHNNPNKVAA